MVANQIFAGYSMLAAQNSFSLSAGCSYCKGQKLIIDFRSADLFVGSHSFEEARIDFDFHIYFSTILPNWTPFVICSLNTIMISHIRRVGNSTDSSVGKSWGCGLEIVKWTTTDHEQAGFGIRNLSWTLLDQYCCLLRSNGLNTGSCPAASPSSNWFHLFA